MQAYDESSHPHDEKAVQCAASAYQHASLAYPDMELVSENEGEGSLCYPTIDPCKVPVLECTELNHQCMVRDHSNEEEAYLKHFKQMFCKNLTHMLLQYSHTWSQCVHVG